MDGYEEAAFALRDVVLAEQRKPGGYDALATFLAFPRTSPLYKAAAKEAARDASRGLKQTGIASFFSR